MIYLSHKYDVSGCKFFNSLCISLSKTARANEWIMLSLDADECSLQWEISSTAFSSPSGQLFP